MNKIKILFLGFCIAVIFLFAGRFHQHQKNYIIIEIESSKEHQLLDFFEDNLKSKMTIKKYKYEHFYILKPRFSLFSCYKCEISKSVDIVTMWANASDFNNPLFDVGPIIFHDIITSPSFEKNPST